MPFTAILTLALVSHLSQLQPPSHQPSLLGRVLDTTGAPIAGAHLTANGAGLTPGPSAVSGPDGEFALTLDEGVYTLKVLKDGFSEWSQVIEVRANGLRREFVLEVSPLRTAITVTEAADYVMSTTATATKTLTPLRDVPQSITVVTKELIKDQMMMSIGDAVRYVPGVGTHAGDNARDTVILRGNTSSADFFVNGVRDDVEYYRDLYNLERLEALKGPNAMIFGRGGGGGVINRITKEAQVAPFHEFSMQGGAYSNKRFAADLNQPLGGKLALRLNGMYENSGSFRKYVDLHRYGVNPTLTISPGQRTRVTLGYEQFRDNRMADRGISSFQGRPAEIPVSTYFGNPDDSHVRAAVKSGSASIEQQFGGLNFRNRMLIGDYGKMYQNYVPGAITADRVQVAISAYNNATRRLNFFNQTDAAYTAYTGGIRHNLLAGVEAGRQLTDNFRNTGYFNNTATSLSTLLADPIITIPVTFRQSATDANNHVKTNVGAAYVQDQVQITRFVQLLAGIRFDHFDLQYHNNRTGDNLRRIDNPVSPRLGIVFKPGAPVSIYGSYSVSYLPSSGDQFSSLTVITQQVKPEKFSNYEIGAKWDLLRALSLTAAVYRLNRTNTRSTDPNDPARIVQTGSQRTDGFEMGVNGSMTRKWSVAGGYAYQDAFVTSATTAARAGAQVGQVPHHTFSLWNHYQVLRRLGVGMGVLNRADMFAAIDNTVTVPGYTRADAAVFLPLTERIRLQANVENLFNARYFVNAQSNTNISPGSPRAVRAGLTARF